MRNLILINENRKKKFLPILFLFLFTISLTSIYAAPPFLQSSSSAGLGISYPNVATLQQNQTQYIRFWAYNLSNGSVLSNSTINCTYNLLDKMGLNILKKSTPYIKFGGLGSNGCTDCFNFNITGGNFSYAGFYSYQIRCDGSGIGGFITGSYEVTPKGNVGGTDTNNIFWIFIILTWGVAFVGFFGRNVWVTVFGGMGMIIFGIYILVQGITIYQSWVTQAISYFSMGLGAFFMIYSLIEYLEEQN